MIANVKSVAALPADMCLQAGVRLFSTSQIWTVGPQLKDRAIGRERFVLDGDLKIHLECRSDLSGGSTCNDNLWAS